MRTDAAATQRHVGRGVDVHEVPRPESRLNDRFTLSATRSPGGAQTLRGLRVCPPFVIRELDFAGAAEHFHDGAYLSATQPV